MYFARVHPEYLWGYAPLANVISYAFRKPRQCGSYVSFWDLRSQECTIKQVSIESDNSHIIKGLSINTFSK